MLSSLYQIRDLYPPVRIQNSRETLLLVLSRPRVGRKHARDLGENADGVYRVDVRDDVAVRVLVFQKERTEVGLAALHHFLDRSDDRGVADDDGLVEARKKRAAGDGKGEDLRVDFRDGLFGN